MPVYKGSSKLGLISKEGFVITHVYKGSQLVYRFGFDPVTFTENSTWTVPTGIKQIRVDCAAGQGYGGLGGRVQCILATTPGQVLYINIGKARYSTGDGTYNASDIRLSPSDMSSRVVVAGGGGNNGGRTYNGGGGAGGGLVGASGGTPGYGAGGTGGTQTSGGWCSGSKAGNGAPGTFGYGGAGAGGGGYGGDGLYGGAGGGYGGHNGKYYGGGGGGGSSYTHPNLCSEVVHTQGYQAGNGYITISMVE